MAIAVADPTAAETVADWRSVIAEASTRFGIPSSWIEHVMMAESGGQTLLAGRPIRSRVGAIGLMQLMPSTWDTMRRSLGLGANPDDPRDNILAGTGYLRWLYDRFGYPGLFAAYNAGPTRYADHLATGRVLPNETVGYLGRVSHQQISHATFSDKPPREHLFAIEYRNNSLAKRPAQTPLAGLFAVKE